MPGFFETAVGVLSLPLLIVLFIALRNAWTIFSWIARNAISSMTFLQLLDWTNWTFWLITLALIVFGFCLRDIYDQWYFRKVRKEARDEVRGVRDSDAAS